MTAEVVFFRRSCVVIDCGNLQEVLPDGSRKPPCLVFWLDWIDEAGEMSGMVWDGSSYSDALREASEWGLPIIDNARGRA